MTFLNFWVLSVFAIYFFVLIAIAIVRSRQMREMQDYVLGSRRLNAVTAALSASSSAVSSGSMLVVPALAFVDGAQLCCWRAAYSWAQYSPGLCLQNVCDATQSQQITR